MEDGQWQRGFCERSTATCRRASTPADVTTHRERKIQTLLYFCIPADRWICPDANAVYGICDIIHSKALLLLAKSRNQLQV